MPALRPALRPARFRARRALAVTAALVLPLLAAGLVGAAAPTASAVTHGEPDAGRHPYVGLLVAQDADGEPLWTCTGSLLSPTLVLTAGHCTEAPAARVELWLDEGHVPRAAGFPAAGLRCAGPGAGRVQGFPCTGDAGGRPHTHPDYARPDFTRHDLGVVVLDAAVTGVTAFPRLPEQGRLSQLAGTRAWFTSVGYGLQDNHPSGRVDKISALRVRLVATPRLLRIDQGWIADFAMLVSSNAATGGTCEGDSGGPNLIGGTDVLAGVTSFDTNNKACTGQNGVYRLDGADDLGWLRTAFGTHLR